MSLSDDDYDYETYSLEFYTEDEGPPLIKKKSRIILTVVQNDVEGLELLLDSPKWYRVTDKYGNNILQIAILRDNVEVFDYMMSLPDFPIDEPNRNGETALVTSLTGFISNDIWMQDYYARQLLKRDVKIDAICYDGMTLLHCAFDRCFVEVARRLLEKGADVNAKNDEGNTPLHLCFNCDGEDFVEAITMLLYYGADPEEANIFESAIIKSGDIFHAQEVLFYYIFDQYTCNNVTIIALIEMAHNCSPLFYKVLENASEVVYNRSFYYTLQNLLSIEPQCLKALLENCGTAMEDLLEDFIEFPVDLKLTSLDNLDILINSKFKPLIIEMISKINASCVIENLKNNVNLMDEVLSYLLSYGMTITDTDLLLIYKYFNNNELFRILLHMDIKMCDVEQYAIIPALYYDININLDTYLQNPHRFSTKSGIEELLYYSAHPKLKELCTELNENDLIERASRLPEVPLLVELSRNVFRKYFIEKFKITTSRQFYTMLQALPISTIHRKIISFEYKLYG